MSYISAVTHNNKVIVWERNTPDHRDVVAHPAPHYFYYDDPDGKYTTIYDTPVSKAEASTGAQLFQLKKQHQSNHVRLWESDISPDFRVLSNEYYNKPAPSLNVTLFDIEVDHDPSTGITVMDMVALNPYAPVNSISLIHIWKKEIIVICVPPTPDWDEKTLMQSMDEVTAEVPLDPSLSIKYYFCNTEQELLIQFLLEIQNSDAIGGWNSNFFDVTYIARRIAKVLDKEEISLETTTTVNARGKPTLTYLENPNPSIQKAGKFKWTKQLDFPTYGNPTFKPVSSRETNKLMGHTVELVGRISVDYMELIKKYEPGERSSYKLSSVSNEILVDPKTKQPLLPKLEYKGSLRELYRSNFAYFCRYNIRDVEILYGFEQKLGYIGLANEMMHLSSGLFKHVTGTLKLAEYALINYCHHTLKRVVNNATQPEIDQQIDGALVLLPQVGLHEYIAAIDLASLYPSAIRSINISPETIRGQFPLKMAAVELIKARSPQSIYMVDELTDQTTSMTASEWRDWLISNQYSISGYGTVFDQNKMGFIPAVLAEWYSTRKHYQKLKAQAIKTIDGLTPGSSDYEAQYAKLKNEADYYDRLQYTFKIKLNSLYGGLTNLYFRFYDIRMGASTTATGRMILQHQCRKVSEIMGDGYDVDFPLYLTTDDAIEGGYTPEEAKQISFHGPKFDGKFQSDSVIYGDSVTGDTLICTETGMIPIEELFGNVDATIGNKEYSNSTLCALTYDKATRLTKYGQIKYVMRHRTTKQLYRVWVTESQYVDVTEDHGLIGCDYSNQTHPYIEVAPPELLDSNRRLLRYTGIVPTVSSRVPVDSSSVEMCVPFKVEPLPLTNQYVYDIEVADTHMFFANHILVHNTDSTYFETYASDPATAIATGDMVAKLVNDSYPEFMKDTFLCTPGYDNIIKAGREIISDRGIFVEKKRYILHLIDLDGSPVDKLKIMGLDTKKTTLPIEVSKQINSFIERFLKGEPWESVAASIVEYKTKLRLTTNLLELGLPKGVNKIEDYTATYQAEGMKARLPGHVAASIFYNMLLKEYNDTESTPITSGMKIKVFYIIGKHGKFKSIAVPTDAETLPSWFVDNFTIDMDAHITRLVDNPVENIIKAIGRDAPSAQTMFDDQYLEI